MSHPLDAVFRPGSVAVVGASTDPRKRGYQALETLGRSGFGGRVLPVNPKGGEILGLRVHRSVEEVPGVPELALICTPAPTVPGILEACGRKGIRAAVILAVGFGESDEEGRRLEARIREVARSSGVRVVGPNTSGILNTHHGLNLIGARDVPPGDLALLVQSGNVALSLMLEAEERWGSAPPRDEGGDPGSAVDGGPRGISICASVGNEAGVGFHEYLEYLGREERTRAVAVYAEGFSEPRAFLSAAARLTPRTPVVLLKGGRSDVGRAVARSHTGAVSAPYDLLRAGLRQAGVEEVLRGDELLPVAETLAGQPAPDPGRGVAILSDGGGQGTLAADALTEAGVGLASPAQETRSALRELLGRAAAVGNPVDLAGRADAEPGVFARCLELLVGDPAVGCVLVVGLFGGYHVRFADELEEGEVEAARSMARTAAEAGRGILVHSMYASRSTPPLEVLRRAGVPVVGSLDVACRCVTALVRRGGATDRGWDPAGWEADASSGGDALPAAEASNARDPAVRALTEPEARALVAGAGVPVVPGVHCRSEEEARDAARRLGGALAAKVVSAGIPHKTEAGGVILGVEGPDEGAAAYRTLVERGREHLAGADGPDDPA